MPNTVNTISKGSFISIGLLLAIIAGIIGSMTWVYGQNTDVKDSIHDLSERQAVTEAFVSDMKESVRKINVDVEAMKTTTTKIDTQSQFILNHLEDIKEQIK